jgi:hypothetical protein
VLIPPTFVASDVLSSSFPEPHACHGQKQKREAGQGGKEVDFSYGGGFVDFVVSQGSPASAGHEASGFRFGEAGEAGFDPEGAASCRGGYGGQHVCCRDDVALFLVVAVADGGDCGEFAVGGFVNALGGVLDA